MFERERGRERERERERGREREREIPNALPHKHIHRALALMLDMDSHLSQTIFPGGENRNRTPCKEGTVECVLRVDQALYMVAGAIFGN
jgi:hypothetical protein